MGLEAAIVLTVLATMLLAVAMDWLEADVASLLAVLVLAAAGVLRIEEALGGFANGGVLTVGFLFVVAAAVKHSGALDAAVQRLFGTPAASTRTTLARLLLPVAALSGLVNNTPLIALLIPAAKRWSQMYGRPVSALLMPLSFATILGGTCTLLGTSTNLLVSGFLEQRGLAPLGMFELAPVGVLLAVAGALYLIVVAPKLLPDRSEAVAELEERRREFMAEVRVEPRYPFVGQTIERAGLRHLKGLFLFAVLRGEERIAPVDPRQVLEAGDRLLFTGVPETLVELQKTPGLVPVGEPEFHVVGGAGPQRIIEVVVSHRSPLLARTVRESGFRGLYGAAILAVHRHGERLAEKIGDIELKAGDTLLLIADPDFAARWRGAPDFYVVSAGEEVSVTSRPAARVTLLVSAAMLGAILTGWLSPVLATGLAAGVLVAARCLPVSEARRAMDWKVLVVLASSLGLGVAVERSGIAVSAADVIGGMAAAHGAWVAVLGVFLATATLSQVASNGAVAAMFVPVALALGERIGVDPRPLVLTVVFAASTCYVTPLGYQTNLLVWGPGNYRFSDFVRLGAPLTALVTLLAVTALSSSYAA